MLRELIENYLRSCDNWRERPDRRGTYLQWEDLTAKEGQRFLSTDLAAVRQMTREALHDAKEKP
jgi:hypothetical protein